MKLGLRLRRFVIAPLLCLILFAGCGSSGNTVKDAGEAEKTLGNIVVDGAASLSAVLPEILNTTVLQEFPDTNISYNFNGSSSLVDELAGGAPADVLFTADEKNMQKALDQDLVTAPEIFISNSLVMVVPVDNPAKITGFTTDELANTRLVVCAAEVPCGNATHTLAQLDGVEISPVSEEQSVSDVLDKVVNGEADAGIVYKTDAQLKAEKLAVIQIPNSDQVVNNYMLAVTSSVQNREGAKAVIDAVKSSAGQEILRKYGFNSQM